jgi:serine protease Do
MRRTMTALMLAIAAAPAAGAQTIVTTPRAQGFTFSTAGDRDRAILGITTSTSAGRRDTLGLLVSAVTPGSPAEKAGIEEGSRLVAINGVALKLSREDADDEQMAGVPQNRLVREMRKVKPGDEVTLEVWGGGRVRTAKVKTVAADELSGTRRAAANEDDHAAIGVFLSSTGNARDTVGVFVQSVVAGGPAEKAGIVEGERIASINGVDVRVPRDDAGDWSVASSRIDRLEREVRKLKPGQPVDLVVVSGGRSRTVKVTPARASDLPAASGFRFRTGDGPMHPGEPGAMIRIPNIDVRTMPRVRVQRGMEDPEVRAQVEEGLEEGLRGLRDALPELRRGLQALPRKIEVPAVRKVQVRTIL